MAALIILCVAVSIAIYKLQVAKKKQGEAAQQKEISALEKVGSESPDDGIKTSQLTKPLVTQKKD